MSSGVAAGLPVEEDGQGSPEPLLVAERPLSDERAALREVLAAFISSRLLIWVAGIATLAIVGLHTRATVHDSHHLTQPFATPLLNYIVGPGARFDSSWYLSIAKHGYVDAHQAVFFPLFPAAVALLGASGMPHVIAGILLSCVFAVAALWLLHRLVELDFGQQVARNTVWITAWLPVALFLSAVYTEALFLLLCVGSIYSARIGRWWLAGLLGCLAAATRNSGILLIAPLLILYLYGPRDDRSALPRAERWRPRYAARPDILWIGLVPVGLLAYLVYLHFAIGQPLAPFSGQHFWHRSFEPLAGVWLGAIAAVKSILVMIPGLHLHLGRHLGPLHNTQHLFELGFLVLSGWLLWFGRRRLPLAYNAFAVLSLAMAISVPARGEPLKSLPRFTLAIFPLWIALGLWATERGKVKYVLAVCAPLIALWTFLFTAWLWAA